MPRLMQPGSRMRQMGSSRLGSLGGGTAPAIPSTLAFTGADAGITYGGRFSAPFTNAGIDIIQRVGTYSEIRTVVTGTECRLRVFADGSTHRWTVDGGSEQTASPGGSVNDWITLFTGLSDAAHTVVYYAGNYPGYSPDMFEVTGASPAIAAQSGYTNNHYRCGDASGMSLDGSAAPFSNEGYDLTCYRGSCRFKATTGTIRVWCRKDAADGRIALVTDGDAGTLVRATPGDGWGWVSFTGLDSGAEHTYRLMVGTSAYYYSVMVTGSLNTTALTAWPADYWWGDSITAATNIGNGDTAPNFPQLYGISQNRGWQILGTAGGTLFTQGQAQKESFGDANPACENLFIMWGFNDQSSGTTSLANWRIAIDAVLTQVVADKPSAKIYWPGIIRVPGSATNRASYNAELADAIADLADADVVYIDSDGWNGGSNISNGDGTHPDAAGAEQIYDGVLAGL